MVLDAGNQYTKWKWLSGFHVIYAEFIMFLHIL